MRIRVGNCELDTRARALTRDGAALPLTPKAFTLLETLAEAHPGAVSKQDLYAKLWGEAFVEEGNLHTLVSEVRTAIGDDAHSVIVTKHRFGYALASPEKHGAAQVRLVAGTLDIPLHYGENIIGRDQIASPDVSRRHARVVVADDSVTIEDLGSKNGTWIGSQRIDSCEVSDGDELLFGHTRVRVRFAQESTITAAPPASSLSSPE
jgi:DNA-binding winged helix-turn-helix (wHTH) protein